MSKKELFQYTDLFEAVQMQQVFADGKTFTDCIAKFPLEEIDQKYQQQKNNADFDLKTFVYENFTAPVAPQSNYAAHEADVKDHINNLWTVLTRSADAISFPTGGGQEGVTSLIALPFPYIVPGGRFGEIYYWDSFFTMLGLQASGKVDIIQNMVDNFSFLIDHVGYIPNGNRTYFIGRSQPPFYSLMVRLLADEKGNDILIKYLPQLAKEYTFWMKGSETLNKNNITAHHAVHMPDGSLLNRYWDENDTPRPESYREDVELAHHTKDKATMYRHLRAGAESGWDFSCRWFKDVNDFSTIHTTGIIPVDLNCLMLHLEETLCEAYKHSENKLQQTFFAERVEKRKTAIQQYCWNEEQQFYFDYDFVSGKQKELQTIAAAFPLYFKVASQKQAKAVASITEKNFLQPGGVTTTLEATGQQWDAPNGWAPLQWITIQGLENYGMHDLAKEIAIRWISLNKKVYQRTGKLMEKYNVYNTALDAGGGEYPSQDGFGWTNGVLLKLMEIYDQ
ncbi:alpha,alpha-trehalase TreF [Panacibacter ginsenosidivorans]|uniref:Alpha,alpha-trehalase TreF n=1 Tax=Panacibacter ginsenosidivorans TaxID=1813871 RepID=A0A5B8VCG6_9BACT|nr:alpha,alpha-trehalase TreF [Panacibacter ginsenosidivorans]QEC68376.1 alpha,alpha-trehalase TreF [Panacibacter ginsenosidivorans]